MAVVYRLANDHDLAALAHMRWDFRVDETEGTPGIEMAEFVNVCTAFLRRGLEEGNWVYWLAEVGGEIVSHVFVQRIAKVPKPIRAQDEFGYLTNVYTKPEYRGQGIGSALLQRVCEWAKRNDLEFLITWPSESSRAFYGRAGFAAENEAMALLIRPDEG